jgi:citrate lyase subunit beta / citryl-CoA lyase
MKPRSVLFAPGHKAELVAKLPRSHPDAAIIDWEDSVPPAAKAAARDIIRDAVTGLHRRAPGLPVFVRVNAADSAYLDDDLAALPDGLAGVVLPKAERAGDGVRVAADTGLPVLLGIETAVGVAQVEHLAASAAGVYFGAEDFIADVGGARTDSGLEVLYARSRVVLAARLAGVVALDQVVIRFRDHSRFRADAELGRALGYTGKLCVHPSQVPLAHATFTPAPAEIERARRVVAAHDAAAGGVAELDGMMVDEPLVRRARAVLADTPDQLASAP